MFWPEKAKNRQTGEKGRRERKKESGKKLNGQREMKKKSFFFALQSEFKVKLWKSTMKERESGATQTLEYQELESENGVNFFRGNIPQKLFTHENYVLSRPLSLSFSLGTFCCFVFWVLFFFARKTSF